MILFAAAAQLVDLGTYLVMGEAFELNPVALQLGIFAIFAKLAVILLFSSVVMVLYAREKYPLVQWGLLQVAIASGFFAASTNLVVIL